MFQTTNQYFRTSSAATEVPMTHTCPKLLLSALLLFINQADIWNISELRLIAAISLNSDPIKVWQMSQDTHGIACDM